MKLYSCSHCNNRLYFENDTCLVCHHMVGFDADALSMVTLEEVGGGLADIRNKKKLYHWCENASHGTCNWLIPADASSPFCIACQLNRTIPELSDPQNLSRWKRIEVAKHRLVYSLLRLKLPVFAKKAVEELPVEMPVMAGAAGGAVLPKADLAKAGAAPSPAMPANNAPAGGNVAVAMAPAPVAPPAPEPPEDPGIAFDFMANISPDEKIMTGHNQGVITLNIEEADDAKRARNKQDLGEKYRTLLGHFRHEIGHYYWDRLIRDSALIDEYRRIFGDERQDYSEALKTYYANSAPADWMDHFISPYASAHSWEDWAETWAHYMHLMDTLETAYSFGIGIHPGKKDELAADISRDPYNIANFDTILGMWLPLTFAVNSLNRSMGHSDFYPFVISATVTEKLRFIHAAAGAGRKR